MTKKEKIIYLTGFFDGEGHVSILTRKNGYTDISLQINNTDKNVLDWIKKNFNGKIYTKKVYIPSHKPQWKWQIYGKKASAICKLMYPFSIVKKKKIKEMKEYYDINI
mgnify:CR=1 FL=1|tara:strand:+ start:210 stop:533 length:324 start_codon:yes stop_codon:yes gene_type:complete